MTRTAVSRCRIRQRVRIIEYVQVFELGSAAPVDRELLRVRLAHSDSTLDCQTALFACATAFPWQPRIISLINHIVKAELRRSHEPPIQPPRDTLPHHQGSNHPARTCPHSLYVDATQSSSPLTKTSGGAENHKPLTGAAQHPKRQIVQTSTNSPNRSASDHRIEHHCQPHPKKEEPGEPGSSFHAPSRNRTENLLIKSQLL